MREVKTHEDIQAFLLLPLRLYSEVSHWVQPLDRDIENVFNPAKNKKFRHGKAKRWVLFDSTTQPIGRIAAFFDRETALAGNEQPTGGIGFFECCNDVSAAELLFDTAQAWLEREGMEAMDGPINFGSRERWWGLLVDGFECEPNYQCNYHLPYYQELFEACGFHTYFRQYTFGRKIKDRAREKILRKARLVAQRGGYTFNYLKRSEWSKLAKQIMTVYNQAWVNRTETDMLTLVEAEIMVKQMRIILDERLLWFGYYQGEPVAFFLSIPDLNPIVRALHGKTDLLRKLKFLWLLNTKAVTRAVGILFGVVPTHQGKGVDGALIDAFSAYAETNSLPYETVELNWIGDFNPKMLRVVEQIGAHVVKTHITYRKLFDEQKSFKRMPVIY